MKSNNRKSKINTNRPAGNGPVLKMCTCLLTGLLVGIVGGCGCTLLLVVTTLTDSTFHANEWLLYLLPLTGIAVVILYDRICRRYTLDANALYRYYRDGEPISPWLAPLIFISTSLAYLTGGSVGRAGPSLQIGGCLAAVIQPFIPGKPEPNVVIACGMAAAFTAIFNTPFAGMVFGIEMLILPAAMWYLIFPTAVASFTTWGIACIFGVSYTDVHTDFNGAAVSLDFGTLWRVVLIALTTCLIGRLFCYGRRITTRAFAKAIKNPFLRVLAGTVLVILITLAIGSTSCNGLGYVSVGQALKGEAGTLDCLWKYILTLITLGCGIRGGEISPIIFIGATFGCTVGSLIGLNPCLGAAVGFLGTLSSVTNASIAIFIMGLELIAFSPATTVYFAITCLITHVLSGTCCLYSLQDTDRQLLKVRIR